MSDKIITIKEILLTDGAWWKFYNKYKKRIRHSIVVAIVKLLSCKDVVRGYKFYKCSNKKCEHTLKVPHTCKSKACSSCGKKATAIWVAKQNKVMPNTEWQHITFTMPCELWDLFWYDRSLLNNIGKLAAECIKIIADKKNVMPAIFVAIHTFGRSLNRNVHIHLSTTRGGLSKDFKKWKKLYFNQHNLMSMWRYRVIKMFRDIGWNITISDALKKQLNHTFTFNNFLDELYAKTWVVHCAKATSSPEINVNYLSRYLKRPPIANSKLKHYDGRSVVLEYLDHNTKSYKESSMNISEFIPNFIQHIPDIGFRMIRYYGVLANRVRSKLLPIVYRFLGQNEKGQIILPTFAWLMKCNFHLDPMRCTKCGNGMLLAYSFYGITNAYGLLLKHPQLAARAFS